MNVLKSRPSAASMRGEKLRQAVLDAAEALLREGQADFSMRDLAGRAGVSFATPFNQFGSKVAIMHALSARRIDMMAARFADTSPLPAAVDRILLATSIATRVMLEESRVNRTVMGWVGAASPSVGNVLVHSSALWALALGAGEGLTTRREGALQSLPTQLAFAFRGVLSFWTAGELSDDALEPSARELAMTVLSGFVRQ